jgi:hypothetical protein
VGGESFVFLFRLEVYPKRLGFDFWRRARCLRQRVWYSLAIDLIGKRFDSVVCNGSLLSSQCENKEALLS